MRFRFFTIPAFDPDTAQDALNAFCAQHRIVASDRHFVDQGVDSFWAVCVTWVEGAAPAFPAQGKRERVDYREVLGEADFAVYSELRRLRKHRADREGVPATGLFTCAQRDGRVPCWIALAPAQGDDVGDLPDTPRFAARTGALRLVRRAASVPLPHEPWPSPHAFRCVRWPYSRTTESPSGRRPPEGA